MKKIIACACLLAVFFTADAQIKSDKKVVTTGTPVVTKPVEKKPIVVVSKPVAVHQPLKITSHTDGQDAYGAIQILGTGEPGLEINVSCYAYAEVTPKQQGKSLWQAFKNLTIPTETYAAISGAFKKQKGTEVKEKNLNTYTVTIDKNGKWYIPVFQSFGSTDWMRNAFIPFAWLITATAKDPNYRAGNTTSVRLGCAAK
jgi:hypothetical protein